MDAIITGVESYGLFCQGLKVPSEGMVHISTLTDDFYTYNQTSRTLTGDRTKSEFRLGDPVKVLIANVDVDRRQLDLRIVSAPSKTAKKRPPATKKKSASKTQFKPIGKSADKSKKPSGKNKKSGGRRKRK